MTGPIFFPSSITLNDGEREGFLPWKVVSAWALDIAGKILYRQEKMLQKKLLLNQSLWWPCPAAKERGGGRHLFTHPDSLSLP